MAKFVVEFSPPVKIKYEQDETNIVMNYQMILAPFQKQTQIEFANIKLKEKAVRFLTVINPLDKPLQFVLPPPSDDVNFDVYEFTLQPHSQHELSITWQPSSYGNMRKLIKIEQVGSNRKYDFVILGNCNDPLNKKSKGITSIHAKKHKLSLIKKQLNGHQKKMVLNKTKIFNSKSERIVLVEKSSAISESICTENLQSPLRRQTYLVEEKENLPDSQRNIFGRNTMLTSPERSFKRPDKDRHNHVFNNHFDIQNQNKSFGLMSDDSLDEPVKGIVNCTSPFNNFCLTPIKNSENLLTPFSTEKRDKSYEIPFGLDDTDGDFTMLHSPSFKPRDTSTASKTRTPEDIKPTKISVNLCSKFENNSKDELNKASVTFIKNSMNPESFISPPEVKQPYDIIQKHVWTITPSSHHRTRISSSGSKPKRPSYVVKNSPFYKHSPKASIIGKNKSKQYSILSPRTAHLKTSKLDKCDQYLKCLANPKLVYHSNAEDPFLKLSQYYEAEWLNRQEADMIRWLNALLMPSDKLVDEEQSGDLEQAAVAWVEASKCHKNKPLQFATQKDLFVAQIYQQSPQQWSALRKATTNLMTSSSVSSVLSKLTVSIDKDLITVRDDRQIHLDLSLKKKITDLLKCYNPLWLRIGLEAIFGQIIHVKAGSNDLSGLGWFIRKNLFNNDFVKQKFTKTNVLQVNLPSYNIAMKKFILRKILMLVFFLDRAKEQQLIRHNPCLFKIDSPYKSSYDFLMGFCADMVTAHGDIVRRLRSISYDLTHKQTHLDEVDYAVKSLNDLRDGTRITRVVEILFNGDPLSQKLRLPAISKLQKIHNVNLAMSRISENITIEGNISTRDIVNGHREKMLSLFWQIIYKYLTPRYNNAATKIQNWWRNSSLKLVILKRIRAKQIFKRKMAATKIQAFVRGYLTRKQWPIIHSQLLKNHEKLHLASTTIKRYLQNKLKLLTEERKRFIILRKTTIFVQRKIRAKLLMKKKREEYLKLKKSVILIQKVFRGFIIRKNWPDIKQNLLNNKMKRIYAINIIKRALRKNLPPSKDELYYKKLNLMVLVIQRKFKANNLMKVQLKKFLSLKRSTITLQRRFRAKQAMKYQMVRYAKLKLCVLKLQAFTRGYIARKQWPTLRSELRVNKMRLTTSSNIIKRTLRKNLPLTEDRIKFLQLKESVIILQRRFRAMRDMKQQREQYLQLMTVTLKLQSLARGYILRKQWPVLRNKLQEKRSHLINCSNIVKRCLRKNLPVTEDRIKFLKLKMAVTILQRRYKAMEAMKNERQTYVEMKMNVIKVQSVVRGYIVRKRWPMLRNELQIRRTRLIGSSNIIKKALRKNLPPTDDRIKFLQLKKSVTVLQRRFRAMRDMKQQREQYLQLMTVTLKLQSLARGYILRKQWPVLRNKLQEKRSHLINCSNIVKRCLRKNLPVTEDRIKFLKLKMAVTVLQRRYRAMKAMKNEKQKYIEMKTNIIKLQSIVRGFIVRKQWLKLQSELMINRQRLIFSSNIIKRTLRKNLPITNERLKFLKLRNATIVIQSTYRANKQEKQYQTLRYNVITIQRRFRANIAMKQQKQIYDNTRTMTIKIQAYARGYLIRKKWPETKNELIANKKRLTAASDIIKKFLRRCLPTTQEHLEYLQIRRAVINIQARYRALIAMKLAKREYLLLRGSAITLQRKYRAHMAMLTDKRQYTQLKKSAVVLQAHTRGYLARKNWPHLKITLEIYQKRMVDTLNCKRLLARHAFLFELGVEMRAAVQLRNWTRNVLLIRENLQKENAAAIKIQAIVRGFLIRKRLPQIMYELKMQKQMHAATLIQALWRGYSVRKIYQCRRETIRIPKNSALTLGRRHNDVEDVLNRQKRNIYSYKELATVFWNLDTCTSLSKELCLKTADGVIIDHIFHFLQYSNQSQPSIEAREPAIRVLTNLLKYHETSWHIWMKTVNTDIVKELIKMMKTCCGKIIAYKLYCTIGTWFWIALQDPVKKQYIQNIPNALVDLKFMMDTLNKKYKMCKIEKKTLVLPSTRPTWSIGSKCQKCFNSDLYATTQICKILNIVK